MTETPHDAAADPQQIIAELQRKLNERTAERDEATSQQAATADILKVISRSTFDLQAVLDALTESAARLCGADMATITRKSEGGDFYHVTNYNFPADWVEYARKHPFKSGRGSVVGLSLIEKRAVQVADVLTDPEYTRGEQQKRAGFRTVLAVPLQREGKPIGVFILCRRTVSPFLDKQIKLMSGFTDQAVIAIENARLFEEVQAKTRDLTEALVYQNGSSNILKVISSSPTDVAPTLKAIVESACEICEAYDAIVLLKEGADLHFSAHHGPIPIGLDRWPINRKWVTGRCVIDKVTIHIPDRLSDKYDDEFPDGKEMVRQQGHRSILSVPLLRGGESIGAIALRRREANPFTDKQIALLQTFADQAVIAIGNVRLFDEVQAKTRDLAESLEQQTATSEVLQAISSSPGELEPVFQKMLENATRVCGANFGIMNLWDGEKFNIVAGHDVSPAFVAFRKQNAHRSHPEAPLAAVDQTHRLVHVPDMRDNRAYLASDPNVVALVDIAGARTLLIVPMLKEDELIGTISIFRQEVRPFTDKQVALVGNFTKQAVIAIENTRLLRELRERTMELSLSLDELRTAQDRLVQTEKLASLGQLTAGIAHEIKNPLNFVNNFSALSSELIDELDETLAPAPLDQKMRGDVGELTKMLKSNLDKVVQHGKRADSIVKNMLLHSREGSGEQRSADINALVEESLNLAYHGARAEKPGFNITLQRNFDPTAGMADVYPQEISRVLLNLISNGFYAATQRAAEIGDGFESALRATTRNLGDRIEIRIRDNGTGIPTGVKEKIFNPFFTTKPAGEGTGLGLSMSHDIIVKQHGGTIDVDTVLGLFTEFKIILPRAGASLVKPGEHP
jgi:two-component system, NtrC family, sensor kinase